MGQILDAVCECGYRKSAVLGAGRSNFKEVCKFPHYCNSCSEVIDVDIFKEQNCCPNCTSLNIHTYEALTKRVTYKVFERLSDITLRKYGYHRRDNEQHSWYGKIKNHTILRVKHFCPKCKNDSLSFFTSMMFY